MKLNTPNHFDVLFTPQLCETVDIPGEKGKRLRVKGKIQQIDKVNENNRAYPKRLWDKVLAEQSGFMKRIRNRQVLGVLEHPEKGGTKLGEVSHFIESVWVEGSDVFGDIIVLKTPSGAILEELFDLKIPVGVSSRANGDVRKRSDGVEEVLEEGFDLETFDFVYRPSVSDANPIPVTESKQSGRPEGNVMDLKESVSIVRDAEDLVREAQKAPTMTVVQLIESVGKMQAIEHSLSSVEESCKSDANVARGKIQMVLPTLRALVEKKIAEGTSPATAGKVGADVVRKLLMHRKQLAERISALERNLIETNARLNANIGAYKDRAVNVVESLLDEKEKATTDVAALQEKKERAINVVAELLSQKDRAISVVESLLDDKDRAIGVVTELLDQKDRAIGVVESLLNDKDRAIGVVTEMLDKKDRSVRIVEGLLDKLDEKEAKLSNLYQVLKSVVERARLLQRNSYLATLFHDNPSLKQHKARFEKCSTVVECQGLVRTMGVSVNETKTGHDGNVTTRRPSHLPVEGAKAPVVESVAGQKRGFIHLAAKKEIRG